MPAQTGLKNLLFPDGAKVSIKEYLASSYTDIGAINSSVAQTLENEENQVTTANAGKSSKQIKEMTMSGSFDLIHWNIDNLTRLAGGMFEQVDTAGSPLATIPIQTVAPNWTDNTLYNLTMQTSSSDSTLLKMATQPVLTSVILNPASVNETLVEDSEYQIVIDSDSPSGWSILFISGNMTEPTALTLDIVVTYGTNTPVANSTIFMGTSTLVLNAFAMKIEHTDDAGLKRTLELFAVDMNSGGFQFNFLGANEEGLETIPLSYTANIDTSLTDGRQLASFSIDTGAA